MPWSSTSDLQRELIESPDRVIQASIISDVIVSSFMGPNVGRSWVRTMDE
jgi:hypothetical protein